ncbi:MerR family transcriptional regulator [Streptomyces palmae]|uniref:MerR family transcriptional regulator n=1 Tax=Streptomyces palmae TaxID=1701085 RepID=UPI001FD825DF|nr:MerR family transcriptional regulator [Streptomyces palmae]
MSADAVVADSGGGVTGAGAEYRIEDLAHRSGATVRTIRAYQDRGLLPRPERRGRANVYGDAHLARLRQIAELLDRGYTLASIKELLEAWDAGRGLGGVLGLVAEVGGPWSSEEAVPVTHAELAERFGGAADDSVIADAVELGVLEPVPGRSGEFLVPSPAELAVAAELHAAGIPLPAVTDHLRELRGQVEHIAGRFLDFTTEHVFQRYLDHRPTEAEVTEAADLVRRLRPLAQQTVEAELARAMRTLATRYVRSRLAEFVADTPAAPEAGKGVPEGAKTDAWGAAPAAGTGTDTAPAGAGTDTAPAPGTTSGTAPAGGPDVDVSSVAGGGVDAGLGPIAGVGPCAGGGADRRGPGTGVGAGTGGVAGAVSEVIALPAGTVETVRALVGEAGLAEFIAAAADREVRARTMDALAARHRAEPPDGVTAGRGDRRAG